MNLLWAECKCVNTPHVSDPNCCVFSVVLSGLVLAPVAESVLKGGNVSTGATKNQPERTTDVAPNLRQL